MGVISNIVYCFCPLGLDFLSLTNSDYILTKCKSNINCPMYPPQNQRSQYVQILNFYVCISGFLFYYYIFLWPWQCFVI